MISTNPDIIFIHGGTNDCTLKSELGEVSGDLPIRELDEFKFRSAYASMVRKLMEYYPDAQLILIIGNALSEEYVQDMPLWLKRFMNRASSICNN